MVAGLGSTGSFGDPSAVLGCTVWYLALLVFVCLVYLFMTCHAMVVGTRVVLPPVFSHFLARFCAVC